MNVLDEQLEKACRYYAGMGIKGFKVDFLDRDDQKAVEMVYRIAETTAKYKLFVDFHGMYKPTGINRTFPNAINFEGVFGMEELKWSNPDAFVRRNYAFYSYDGRECGLYPGSYAECSEKGLQGYLQ